MSSARLVVLMCVLRAGDATGMAVVVWEALNSLELIGIQAA